MAKHIEPQGTADFDWEALQLDGYNLVERSELGDRYEKTLTSIMEKEVIQGTVVLINKKEVIINMKNNKENVKRTACITIPLNIVAYMAVIPPINNPSNPA